MQCEAIFLGQAVRTKIHSDPVTELIGGAHAHILAAILPGLLADSAVAEYRRDALGSSTS